MSRRLLLSLTAAGCLGPVDLARAPCPCAGDFRCCQRDQICVDATGACPEELEFVLLSPNGGENWARGSDQTIRWQIGRSTGSVRVDFDPACDGNPTTLASAAPNTGAHFWTVSDVVAAASACVMVTDNDDPLRADQSDGLFTIRGLFVAHPEPSASWPIGARSSACSATTATPGCVGWGETGMEGRDCDVELSRDSGASYTEVLGRAIPCTGSEHASPPWEVTGPATDTARVRIREHDLEFPNAQSGLFSIVP